MRNAKPVARVKNHKNSHFLMGVSVSLLLGVVACNKGSGLSGNAGLTLMSKINIALGRDSEAADLMSWETCTAYAASAKEKGDYAKARVYFAKAIEKAEKFDPEDPRLPTALRNLAGTYLDEKKPGRRNRLCNV